jgi:hypothetical protein
MSMRVKRSLAAASALLLTTALAACSSAAAPGPHPGTAAAIGPAPTAVLPAGEHATARASAPAAVISPSTDPMGGDDRQVGPAYDFTVAQEPPSALVSFTVDPGKLAASTGVPGATPAGLYIQIFEPALGSWIPLRSTYDPGTRTVTATAPHLSLVSLAWTDVKCAVTCPATLFAKVLKRFASDIVGNIDEAWSPAQEDDQCAGSADANWTVRSSISQLTGCVIDGESSPVAQERNPLLLPMRVWQPAGAPHASLANQPYLADGPDLTALIAGIIDWAGNATLLAPREYGVVPVDLPQSGTLSMLTQPDALGLVMDVIQSVLFALPGEKSEDEAIDNAVRQVLPEFEAKMAEQPGSVSLSDILDAVHGNVEKQEAAAPGPELSFVDMLSAAYECATAKAGKALGDGTKDGGITNGFLEAAIELGKSCAETGIEAAGKEESHSFKAVLDVIDGIPNFGKTIREGVQFAELGPSAMLGTTTISGEPSQAGTDQPSQAGTNEPSQAGEQFQPFGLSVDNFAWSAGGGQIAITPPLGADEYSALWGVTDGQQRCDVTVNLDSSLDDPQAAGNFGFAVAPLSSIQSDQPAGASVQYEHEAPPDFAAAGSFVRPAQLPGGAWRVDVAPIPAPDITLPHHVQVTDNGSSMTIEIDGQVMATYAHAPECGGVAIRVWGAGFTFSNVAVS